MKYIRTKQGIFKITGENKKHYLYNERFLNGALTKVLIRDSSEKDDEDIKVSNELEELCDVFVYDKNYDKIIFLEIKKPKREDEIALLVKPLTRNINFVAQGISKTMLQLGNEVYGAIWTDKGLIFVAKINKDGVLELL